MRKRGKTHFLQGCLVIVLLLPALCFFGCTRKSDSPKIDKKAHDRLIAMTDEERQQYIHDYLLEKYDLDCEVTKPRHRPVNSLHNEKNLFASVFTPDGGYFSAWIIPQTSEIVDTAYTYFLKDDVNKYLEGLFTEAGYECRIDCEVFMDTFTEEKYDKNSIPQMLSSEYADNTIKMNIKSHDLDEETAKAILKDVPCRVFAYYVDDLDEEFDIMNSDFSFMVWRN